jgi:hypothetical protein
VTWKKGLNFGGGGVKTAHLDILEDNKKGFVCSGVKTQLFKNFFYPTHTHTQKDNKQ